jgi:hypothetical protein
VAKKEVKREYVAEIYNELKDEILECKKKVVSLYKKKLEEKGFKFYVEFIDKNPLDFELTHMFITKHLDTDRWIYISCDKNNSIRYNRKEYKTFHTIDINKMGAYSSHDFNHLGYKINDDNELKPLTDEEIDKINGASNRRGYWYKIYDPEKLKENYYVKDYTRGFKLQNFFDSIDID